jgi:hypothetical protein
VQLFLEKIDPPVQLDPRVIGFVYSSKRFDISFFKVKEEVPKIKLDGAIYWGYIPQKTNRYLFEISVLFSQQRLYNIRLIQSSDDNLPMLQCTRSGMIIPASNLHTIIFHSFFLVFQFASLNKEIVLVSPDFGPQKKCLTPTMRVAVSPHPRGKPA